MDKFRQSRQDKRRAREEAKAAGKCHQSRIEDYFRVTRKRQVKSKFLEILVWIHWSLCILFFQLWTASEWFCVFTLYSPWKQCALAKESSKRPSDAVPCCWKAWLLFYLPLWTVPIISAKRLLLCYGYYSDHGNVFVIFCHILFSSYTIFFFLLLLFFVSKSMSCDIVGYIGLMEAN